MFDYLLKKAIFTSLTLQQNLKDEEISSLNAYKEDYVGSLNNDFKLILFASFANDEEFIGSEIITKLYEIVKERNFNWFDMKIRISSKETHFKQIPLIKSFFDENFIDENIEKGERLKKIYVCGPPVMNKKLFEDLKKFQINESIIHLV